MDTPVRYELSDAVASITMDDGKANALTAERFSQLNDALDRAEADQAGVVLAGRQGRFSGGFDLKVLTAGGSEAPPLLRAGFELAYRLLSFPQPVVIACTGHAYAMGSFLLLSGDYRVGIAGGDYRITANEVAIGMVLPRAAIEVCRQRLTRAHFDRAVILAEIFSPEAAVEAGYLDAVVPEADLLDAAHRKAVELMALHIPAHKATKLRARAEMLAALQSAIETDDAEMRALL